MANFLIKKSSVETVQPDDITYKLPDRTEVNCRKEQRIVSQNIYTPKTPILIEDTIGLDALNGTYIDGNVSQVIIGYDGNGFPIYRFFYTPSGYDVTTIEVAEEDLIEVCEIVIVEGEYVTVTPEPVSISKSLIGWDGSALSEEAIIGSGGYSFSCPISTLSAIVGLNEYNNNSSYRFIDYGFIFVRGQYAIIENNSLNTLYKAYGNDDVFSIIRSGDEVLYYVNDVLVYKSLIPSIQPSLFLDTSLYSSGDKIVDAQLLTSISDGIHLDFNTLVPSTSGFEISSVIVDDNVLVFPQLIPSESNIIETRYSVLQIESIPSQSGFEVEVRTPNGGVNIIEPIVNLGSNYIYNESKNIINEIESNSLSGLLVLNFGSSNNVISPIISNSTGVIGSISISTNNVIGSLSNFASDHPYAESSNVISSLKSIAGNLPDKKVGAALLVNQGFSQGSGILTQTGRHILTAAHVVDNWNDLTKVDITFLLDDGLVSEVYTPYRVSIHPSWDGNVANGYDIAVVELTGFVDPVICRHPINIDDDELLQTFEKTSYSPRINPVTGATGESGWDTINNKYETDIETLWRTVQTAPVDSLIAYDWDNGASVNDAFGNVGLASLVDVGVANEGFTSAGDSGSGGLVNGKIVGITSYGTFIDNSTDLVVGLNFSYGEVGVDTRVSFYSDWILSNLNVTTPYSQEDPLFAGFIQELRPIEAYVIGDLFELESSSRLRQTSIPTVEGFLLEFDSEIYTGSVLEQDLFELELESNLINELLLTQSSGELFEFEATASLTTGLTAVGDSEFLFELELTAYTGSVVQGELFEFESNVTLSVGSLLNVDTDFLELESTIELNVQAFLTGVEEGEFLEFETFTTIVQGDFLEFETSDLTYLTSYQDTGIAFSTNLKLNEITKYTNYNFDNIIKIGKKYYGVRSTGLFLLNGLNDLGVEIDVNVQTTLMDFNNSFLKMIPYVYIDSSEPTLITPLNEGVAIGSYESNHIGRRTKLARGSKGRFWAMNIKNIKGGNVDLRSLELFVDITKRKV